jgi:hypothetical protein
MVVFGSCIYGGHGADRAVAAELVGKLRPLAALPILCRDNCAKLLLAGVGTLSPRRRLPLSPGASASGLFCRRQFAWCAESDYPAASIGTDAR